MAEQKQSLSVDEQKSIAEAVLRIVASYTDFPKTITNSRIHMDDLKECESIGIYPAAGAVLKKYISGSFEAQFPFTLYYKCKPTSNHAVIEKRNVLDGLGAWMETMEYPELSEKREIQSINRTTAVVLAGKDDAGNSIFQCGFTLKYFKKKG